MSLYHEKVADYKNKSEECDKLKAELAGAKMEAAALRAVWKQYDTTLDELMEREDARSKRLSGNKDSKP